MQHTSINDIDEKEISELDKLPPEVMKDVSKDLNEKELREATQVDWYGIKNTTEECENSEEIDINEDKIDNVDTNNQSISKVVSSMIELFSLKKDNIEINEINLNNLSYFEIKNVKIKDGIIYAKSIDELIEAGIKPKNNNLWVVIPHSKQLSNDEFIDVSIRYVLHNGLWWVALPKNTKIENIEYSVYDCSSNEKLLIK